MKSYINPDTVFKIIPKDVKGATKAKVTKVEEGFFSVELLTLEECYIVNEPVELFLITPQGLLYFETFIKSVDSLNIQLLYPISHRFLQRREYTRIDIAKNIFLTDETEEKKIRASISDISAGGMKISVEQQLSLTKDYKVNIEVDKNITINCYFQPVRIESDNNNTYTVSGRFKILKNIDRISLVQYCFKKQMENQYK